MPFVIMFMLWEPGLVNCLAPTHYMMHNESWSSPDRPVSSSPVIPAVKWHWQHQHTLWLLLISSVLSGGSFRLFFGLFSTFVKRRLLHHDETSGAQALLTLHERYWSARNEVVNHQEAAEQSPKAGERTGRRCGEQSSSTSSSSSCQVSPEWLKCSSALQLMGCVGAGMYVCWLMFEIAAILNTALQFNQSLVGFRIRIWERDLMVNISAAPQFT